MHCTSPKMSKEEHSKRFIFEIWIESIHVVILTKLIWTRTIHYLENKGIQSSYPYLRFKLLKFI